MLIIEIAAGVALGIVAAVLVLHYWPYVAVGVIVLSLFAVPIGLILWAHPEIPKNIMENPHDFAVMFITFGVLAAAGWGIYSACNKPVRKAGKSDEQNQNPDLSP